MLLNENIPSVCTYLENAFSLPTSPQPYESILDAMNMEISLFNKMHLYVLKWDGIEDHHNIINNFDTVERMFSCLNL